MQKRHVLVVEDEPSISELISYNLIKEGFRVSTKSSGEEALLLARSNPPDLIVLDIMLPGIDGLEACRILKRDERTFGCPIIMLSARGEESDVVAGLELGADDYIIKPFSPKVLIARIRSVIRRIGISPDDVRSPVATNGLVVHPGRHEVTINGVLVPLTNAEFKALHFLAGRPGWVFTRYQIVDAIRGDNYPVTERSVDVIIVGIRRKLGKFGKRIETIRGVGYRYNDESIPTAQQSLQSMARA